MGVMTCCRNDCTNIMCDHYSPRHGYLCDECLSELIEGGDQSISGFMGSPKSEGPTSSEAWAAFVRSEFESGL